MMVLLCQVMLWDEQLNQEMAKAMLAEGVLVIPLRFLMLSMDGMKFLRKNFPSGQLRSENSLPRRKQMNEHLPENQMIQDSLQDMSTICCHSNTALNSTHSDMMIKQMLLTKDPPTASLWLLEGIHFLFLSKKKQQKKKLKKTLRQDQKPNEHIIKCPEKV